MCFLWFRKKKKNKTEKVEEKKVEVVSEVKEEATAAPKEEVRSAPVSEATPAPEPEAKTAPKVEEKAAPKAEKKSAAKVEEKAAPKAEKKPAAKVEEKASPEVEEKPAEEKTAAFTGRFEINKTKDGKKYFFNLYAPNKVGIATSQMYASAQSAMIGIKSVMNIAATAPVEDQTLKSWEALPYPKWEIYLDNGEKYRFRLNAANGSCVCHSQGYTTKNACKNGIDSIIRSSRNPEIEKTYLQKKDGN